MLFTQKSRECAESKHIKEDVRDKDGRIILKINVKYPEIKLKKKDTLMRNAAPFYVRTAENFLFFLRNDFAKLALKASESENFVPFGACMNWKKYFEDDRFVSFALKISLFDGKNPVNNEILCQTWERKFGLKCPFFYFFGKDAKKEIIKKYFPDSRGKISFDRFVLCENGFVFFISEGNGYIEKFIPHCEQIENILF